MEGMYVRIGLLEVIVNEMAIVVSHHTQHLSLH